MSPDEAKALAQEFDFAGEIICLPNATAAGVGPGRMLIVKAPGEQPRMGRAAAEYLRDMLPYLSARQEQAISAVKMIAGGPAKEVLDGERIALDRIAKEGGESDYRR